MPAAAASDDGKAWGLVVFAIGATVSLLLPWAGSALAIVGIHLMVWSRSRARRGPARRRAITTMPST
jgi:hypothetical protein